MANSSFGYRKGYPLRVKELLWENLDLLYRMDCRKVSKVSMNRWLEGILVDYVDGRRDDIVLEKERGKEV